MAIEASSLHFRPLTAADVSSADGIRAEIGWNQTAADWQRLRQLNPQGVFLAELANRPVGTVTTTTYGTALGWIGMLLVHPHYRRQGIGTALLHHAIRALQQRGVGCIGLDATPAGKRLYDKEGFHALWDLARWQIDDSSHFRVEGNSTKGNFLVETIPTPLWAQVIALDRETIGVERPHLLRELAQQSDRVATALDTNGQVTGFGMVRPGTHAYMLGPLAAVDRQTAAGLLAALCGDTSDTPIFWDIPQPNTAAIRLAETAGFVRQRPLTRMLLGRHCPTGDPTRLFAIADLATG